MPGLSGRCCQIFPRVADPWEAGITNDSQALLLFQQLELLGQTRAGVVLMEAESSPDSTDLAEQLAAVASVFTGNHVH